MSNPNTIQLEMGPQEADLLLNFIMHTDTNNNNNNNNYVLNTIMASSSSPNHNHNSLVFNRHKTKLKYDLI